MADIETISVSADGTPIVQMRVIDKETGTETPVNVETCTQAVKCSQGIPVEQHLANLYGHANDESSHLSAGEKAEIETKAGAQEKADTAKSEAVAAASLMVESAKAEAAEDATAKAVAARDAAYKYADKVSFNLADHEEDNSNPHNVTAAQVGLGNVPNKSTNDTQPTYALAETLAELTSGEKMSIAFGKIAKAVKDFISHIGDKNNPHGVTAAQIDFARRIYTAHGAFVNADGGDLHGGGTATVTIEPSGLARIDFNFKITQTGTKEDFYAWGLNRDMLSERNKNIPVITPISGGVLSVYDTNGVLLRDKIGFGGFMEGVSQFWCPSRVWQYDGSIGKWPETEFQEGMQLMGTCYGTVEL